MAGISFVVHGRVQGVGFRWHVVRVAEDLGISGEVWNRRDGTVEGMASSDDPEALKSFEDRLRAGPGRVDSVEVLPLPALQPSDEFTIGYTR